MRQPGIYTESFEDINRAGDGGLYPEMLRNRSFEDSVLPEGYIQQEDGVHVKPYPDGWMSFATEKAYAAG